MSEFVTASTNLTKRGSTSQFVLRVQDLVRDKPTPSTILGSR